MAAQQDLDFANNAEGFLPGLVAGEDHLHSRVGRVGVTSYLAGFEETMQMVTQGRTAILQIEPEEKRLAHAHGQGAFLPEFIEWLEVKALELTAPFPAIVRHHDHFTFKI